MNAPAQISDLDAEMAALGARAKAAAREVARRPAEARSRALRAAAAAIRAAASVILAANAQDMARAASLSPAMRDRLRLDPARLDAVARAVDEIAAQSDPVGAVLKSWERPNGLRFQRVAVPIGVIAMIYESRPNVTADAAALCLRSGNAVILRGGSESFASNRAIHAAFVEGLAAEGLTPDAAQLVATTDRAAVGAILTGLGGAIDLVIPRGGKGLVARVQADARVPVLGHLEGLCHTYVHASADPAKARAIVVNAKLRRTGVCGSTETILIDRTIAATLGADIAGDLLDRGCEIRGDAAAQALDPRVRPAADADYSTEHLAQIVNWRTVEGLDEAVAHIARYGTQHTDAIVTEDEAAAEAFLARVDSAIVLVNASTQFADGGEFGFGAEIGISTSKLHARGPVGAAELTTYKTLVRGSGQIRP